MGGGDGEGEWLYIDSTSKLLTSPVKVGGLELEGEGEAGRGRNWRDLHSCCPAMQLSARNGRCICKRTWASWLSNEGISRKVGGPEVDSISLSLLYGADYGCKSVTADLNFWYGL